MHKLLPVPSRASMSTLHHRHAHLPHSSVHKSTIDEPHILHTRSVPRRARTFTHTQAESLNRDIQDRAIITRQMNTWRQSGLGRGAEQSGATEVMISRTKRQTWENRFKSQPQGHTTPQAWPWRTFGNTRAVSLRGSPRANACAFVFVARACTRRSRAPARESVCERVAFKGRRVLGGGKP